MNKQFFSRDRELWKSSPANAASSLWNAESSGNGGQLLSNSLVNSITNDKQLDNHNSNSNNGKDNDSHVRPGDSESTEKKPKKTKANPKKSEGDAKQQDKKGEGSFYEEVYQENAHKDSGAYLQDTENTNEESSMALPWYFSTGERYPKPAIRNRKTNKRVARLLPSEDPANDRITNQLMFVPTNYEQMRAENRNKVILLFNGLSQWNVKGGREVFLSNKCPVDTCTLTENREMASKADMLLYKDHYVNTGATRSLNQIYMIYYLECPYHTPNMPFSDIFNWTATYRKDSDIVAPYEKWEYFDPRVKQLEQDRNYAFNKTKKVAWFVSNCNARNNRLQYANELGKHIEVSGRGDCQYWYKY